MDFDNFIGFDKMRIFNFLSFLNQIKNIFTDPRLGKKFYFTNEKLFLNFINLINNMHIAIITCI